MGVLNFSKIPQKFPSAGGAEKHEDGQTDRSMRGLD